MILIKRVVDERPEPSSQRLSQRENDMRRSAWQRSSRSVYINSSSIRGDLTSCLRAVSAHRVDKQPTAPHVVVTRMTLATAKPPKAEPTEFCTGLWSDKDISCSFRVSTRWHAMMLKKHFICIVLSVWIHHCMKRCFLAPVSLNC